MPKLSPFQKKLVRTIRESESFSIFQESFRQSTGLPLRLVATDDDWCIEGHRDNQSAFCETLADCHIADTACRDNNQRVTQTAKIAGTTSSGCFAGLTSTAVPIKYQGTTIGFLKTGQIFYQTPSTKNFSKLAQQFKLLGLENAQIDRLQESYLETKTIEPQRYAHMVTLLDIFSEQISRQAEDLAIGIEGSIPAPIIKALDYIQKNLGEALNIQETARQAGLSEAHFSRLFKNAIGLTFTDYLTRTRINWARQELLKPAHRISDIAFHIGFQSVSQFNRAFVKLTGQSPSAYRRAKTNLQTH